MDNGFTPLFTAAQFGLGDTVNVLVDLGADPHRLSVNFESVSSIELFQEMSKVITVRD